MFETTKPNSSKMPDVAKDRPDVVLEGAIDWVGMSDIEVPVLLQLGTGPAFRTPAKASVYVSLNSTHARGIHMSRLYKLTQEALATQILDNQLLEKTLSEYLESHQDLSQSAKISISFDALLERKALKSSNSGFRSYPVILSAIAHAGKKPQYFLEVNVTYSSTCPASAALSRQLIQENFKNSFKGSDLDFKNVFDWLGTSKGIVATPHAQRSSARVKIEVERESAFDFIKLIDLIEEALQTPVQTAVKREDEQEFALRNGQNLMFCEDAARRVFQALDPRSDIRDFIAEMKHMESLHPHDAVSLITKGRSLISF